MNLKFEKILVTKFVILKLQELNLLFNLFFIYKKGIFRLRIISVMI